MQYDFTTEGAPRGTNSVKWDLRPDVLPMWVAEMDFPVAPFITDAVRRRVDKGIFGYTHIPESYYQSIIDWFGRRYRWNFTASQIAPVCGIVPGASIAVKALTSPGEKVVFFTPAYNFLHTLQMKAWQKKKVALVENGTWGPTAGKVMRDMLSQMKDVTEVGNMVTIRSRMTEADIPALEALADAILA